MFSQSKVIFIGIAVLLTVVITTTMRNKTKLGVGGNDGEDGGEDCRVIHTEINSFLRCKTRKPLLNKKIKITDIRSGKFVNRSFGGIMGETKSVNVPVLAIKSKYLKPDDYMMEFSGYVTLRIKYDKINDYHVVDTDAYNSYMINDSSIYHKLMATPISIMYATVYSQGFKTRTLMFDDIKIIQLPNEQYFDTDLHYSTYASAYEITYHLDDTNSVKA